MQYDYHLYFKKFNLQHTYLEQLQARIHKNKKMKIQTKTEQEKNSETL